MKKIIPALFAAALVMFLVSCKNTKQKLQEYVVTYNKSTAKSFHEDNITLTTARGYLEDDKIELRFETNLKENESNKSAAVSSFPILLKKMIKENKIPQELIEEGVRFDTYFLADDNTVLAKEVINKEALPNLLK
jgi:hypothetical protein